MHATEDDCDVCGAPLGEGCQSCPDCGCPCDACECWDESWRYDSTWGLPA